MSIQSLPGIYLQHKLGDKTVVLCSYIARLWIGMALSCNDNINYVARWNRGPIKSVVLLGALENLLA